MIQTAVGGYQMRAGFLQELPAAIERITAFATNEAVAQPAVRLDARAGHGTNIIFVLDRFVGRLAAVAKGGLVSGDRIVNRKCNVFNTVAVERDLALSRMVDLQPCR